MLKIAFLDFVAVADIVFNKYIYIWILVLFQMFLKVLQEWTQFWNMSLGLIFSIVMQNFAVIQSAILEKMTFEVAILSLFPDIPERKLSLPSWVMEGGCDVARL